MEKLFGSSYEEIGSSNTNLIIKTAGKIKIQWGKKFIDLIDKNGKIVSQFDKVIRGVNSIDEIKSDGIYYMNGDIIISYNGNNISLISGMGNIYISFMEELELSPNEKSIALKNIGLVSDTLEDIPTNGIVLYNNKLYVINNGNISSYRAELTNPYLEAIVINKQTSEDGSIIIYGQGSTNGIKLQGLKIYTEQQNIGVLEAKQNIDFRINNNSVASISNNGIESNIIKSKSGNLNSGFLVEHANGISTLYVDKVVERQKQSEESEEEEKTMEGFVETSVTSSEFDFEYLNKIDGFTMETSDELPSYVTQIKIPIIATPGKLENNEAVPIGEELTIYLNLEIDEDKFKFMGFDDDYSKEYNLYLKNNYIYTYKPYNEELDYTLYITSLDFDKLYYQYIDYDSRRFDLLEGEVSLASFPHYSLALYTELLEHPEILEDDTIILPKGLILSSSTNSETIYDFTNISPTLSGEAPNYYILYNINTEIPVGSFVLLNLNGAYCLFNRKIGYPSKVRMSEDLIVNMYVDDTRLIEDASYKPNEHILFKYVLNKLVYVLGKLKNEIFDFTLYQLLNREYVDEDTEEITAYRSFYIPATLNVGDKFYMKQRTLSNDEPDGYSLTIYVEFWGHEFAPASQNRAVTFSPIRYVGRNKILLCEYRDGVINILNLPLIKVNDKEIITSSLTINNSENIIANVSGTTIKFDLSNSLKTQLGLI